MSSRWIKLHISLKMQLAHTQVIDLYVLLVAIQNQIAIKACFCITKTIIYGLGHNSHIAFKKCSFKDAHRSYNLTFTLVHAQLSIEKSITC